MTYLIDTIWSMDFKFGNDVLDEMLAKYYNHEKWDIISEKATTNFWFTYNLSVFDNEMHPNGETTEFEEKDFENHIEEQKKVRSKIFIPQNQINNERCPEFYSTIPGMTLALVLLNTYQILSHAEPSTQLFTMVHMGFLYSTILSSIYYKSPWLINWLWRFWLVIFTTINLPNVYSIAIKNSYMRIGYVCMIIYGYYITLISGLYIFSIHKEQQRNKQLVNYFGTVQDQTIQNEEENQEENQQDNQQEVQNQQEVKLEESTSQSVASTEHEQQD